MAVVVKKGYETYTVESLNRQRLAGPFRGPGARKLALRAWANLTRRLQDLVK